MSEHFCNIEDFGVQTSMKLKYEIPEVEKISTKKQNIFLCPCMHVSMELHLSRLKAKRWLQIVIACN